MTERECVEAIKAGRSYMVTVSVTGATVHEQIQRYTMMALAEMRGEIHRLKHQLASREQQAPAEAVIRCKACAGSGAQLCECDRGERPITTCFACSGCECAACGGSGQTREPVPGSHPTPEEDR